MSALEQATEESLVTLGTLYTAAMAQSVTAISISISLTYPFCEG